MPMPLNRGFVYRERVRPEDAGASVLAYHVARFPHSSAEEWRASIASGRVVVEGRRVACDEILRAGDRLEFHRPPWIEPDAPLDFAVVHEDEDVLVVDKPAGLQVLPAGPFTQATLLHLVQSSAADRSESAPVHRLGRGTSGLIAFGKTARARADLSAQFRDFGAKKTYLALVRGVSLAPSVIARHPIGPRAHGPIRIHCVDPLGKPSVTRVRVLARDASEDRSLVAAQPITGRPDQIRIHLAALGAPILGDPLFGPGGVPYSDATPGAGGYFLHAAALSLRHPSTGAGLRLRSRAAWLGNA